MIMNWIGRMLGPNNGKGEVAAVALRKPTASSGAVASVSPLVDSDDALTAEMGRARRYERTFSIVAVSQVARADEQDGERVHPHLAAAGLREVLRESDILCYRSFDDCFVLGLTESERDAARRALERIQTLFRDQLKVDLAVGVAQFPADGLTLGDLVEIARARSQSAEASEPVRARTPEAVNGARRPAAMASRFRMHAVASSRSARVMSGPTGGE
jgi:hypothetical protein